MHPVYCASCCVLTHSSICNSDWELFPVEQTRKKYCITSCRYRAFSLPGQFAPRSESANRGFMTTKWATDQSAIRTNFTHNLGNSPIGPWPIHSLELTLSGPFVLWPFRSRAFSLPGLLAPWNFRSRPIRSLALSPPGLFAPGNESSMELSLRGIFVPWNFRSLNVYLKVLKRAGLPPHHLLHYYIAVIRPCLLYTSPSPRDRQKSRMPSSA